ncbi:sulfatase, partial [Pseudomonas sp. BAgro211]|nr:sulfatase [Pseudomonas sp. BAgro211]
MRTPLLVFWPGHRGNADVSGISHITDLYPTLVGRVGGKAPGGLTGRDLSSYIAKGQPLPKVDALYWAADVMT